MGSGFDLDITNVFDSMGARINTDDFDLSIVGGTATFTSGAPSAINKTGNVYDLTLPALTGGTPNGLEVVTVNPAGATAIYNGAGEAAAVAQTNNSANLEVPPTIENIRVKMSYL